MRIMIVLALAAFVAGGLAPGSLAGGPNLFHHEFEFTVENTGDGVTDGRLRFHIDTLAVPGEEYYIDNVYLFCIESARIDSDFSGGLAPWKFYTNALPIPPTIAITGGMVKITFGSDGPNTQLFHKDVELPAAGETCFLSFDACSTGGPTDPGYGNNMGLELIKHGPPYTKYGLDLSGNPPNAELSIHSCSEGSTCGDGIVDPGEDCDPGPGQDPGCDPDCTFTFCGDGTVGPGEECDDGGTANGDGCDSNCEAESFCGDGTVDPGEACDNGGGSVLNPLTTESSACDTDCSAAVCGDGTINMTAGEECDDGVTKALPILDVCSAMCTIDTGDPTTNLIVCEVFAQIGAMPVPGICLMP